MTICKCYLFREASRPTLKTRGTKTNQLNKGKQGEINNKQMLTKANNKFRSLTKPQAHDKAFKV